MLKKIPIILFIILYMYEIAFCNDFVIPLDNGWEILSRFSGKVNYYKFFNEEGIKFIRANYKPNLKTVILYRKIDPPYDKYNYLKFKWRVNKIPVGADEFVEGKKDNPASVYIFFDGGVKKYLIKYIWSLSLNKGFNFEPSDSSFFNKIHIVVLEGFPVKTNIWLEEKISIQEDFRKYFLKKKEEGIPPIKGIGILSDGDGTKTEVQADYADFILSD